MLKVLQAEIARVAIPFRFGFRHALAERAVGEGVVLTVRDAEGRVGHGECTPRDYVSGETAESAVDELAQRVPRFLGRRFASFEELIEVLTRESAELPRAAHAAWCALELAWLDIAGRVFSRSAGEPLGPVYTPEVEYSAVISASGKEEAAKTCAAIRQLDVRRVKVKVGESRSADLQMLGTVRTLLGDSVGLRVDANGAWDAQTALDRLHDFAEFRLEGCEQPCAAEDLEGQAWLAARAPVPVIADESLVSLADARRLVDLQACHAFNVRVSKCGGLINAGRIRDVGRAAGLWTMLGAHVGETAILAAAGRQFAARTPELRFAEGSYGKLLLEDDVSDAMDLGRGGVGALPEGPGLGIDVDLERIAAHVVARVELGESSATMR